MSNIKERFLTKRIDLQTKQSIDHPIERKTGNKRALRSRASPTPVAAQKTKNRAQIRTILEKAEESGNFIVSVTFADPGLGLRPGDLLISDWQSAIESGTLYLSPDALIQRKRDDDQVYGVRLRRLESLLD